MRWSFLNYPFETLEMEFIIDLLLRPKARQPADCHWTLRVPGRRQKVSGAAPQPEPHTPRKAEKRRVNSSKLGTNGKTKICQEGKTRESLLSKSVKSLKDLCGEVQGCYMPLYPLCAARVPSRGHSEEWGVERGPHWAWNLAVFRSLNHAPGT